MYSLSLLAATGATEYQIKAVFMFKFVKFVDWPVNAFSTTNAPLVVGIIGEDPFGATLDKVFDGETVQNRPVTIKRLTLSDDLRQCHVVFISRSEKDQLSTLVRELGSAPVLTIGDTPRFAERGAVANLVLDKEMVKLEVNLAAARQAKLQISSKLLNLDRVVKVKSDPAIP
jgi:hypothetical protein